MAPRKATEGSKGVMPMQSRRPFGNKNIFPPRRDYISLVHQRSTGRTRGISRLSVAAQNVVATAIGRYCIHEDDWYATNPPDRPRPKKVSRITAPRTLANSVIRPWSWPAVLVFVKEWANWNISKTISFLARCICQMVEWCRPALLLLPRIKRRPGQHWVRLTQVIL